MSVSVDHDEEGQAEKARAVIMEAQATIYGHMQTYVTIVVFGAYAALFTIWSFTRDSLSETEVFWTGLLMGLSVLAFTSFEIFRAFLISLEQIEIGQLVGRELPARQFLVERREVARRHQRRINRVLIPTWIIAWMITVVTGIGAAVLLIGAYVAELVS